MMPLECSERQRSARRQCLTCSIPIALKPARWLHRFRKGHCSPQGRLPGQDSPDRLQTTNWRIYRGRYWRHQSNQKTPSQVRRIFSLKIAASFILSGLAEGRKKHDSSSWNRRADHSGTDARSVSAAATSVASFSGAIGRERGTHWQAP